MTFEKGELVSTWPLDPILLILLGTIAALVARWLRRRPNRGAPPLILGLWLFAGFSYLLAAARLVSEWR